MINLAHIHPMLVHFPLTLVPLALVVVLVTLGREGTLVGRSGLQTAAVWLTVLAAVAAVAAAVFGDMAKDIAVQAGFSEAPIESHAELAVATTVLLCVLALIHLWSYWKRSGGKVVDWVVTVGVVAACGMIIGVGYLGGHLVYDIGVNVQPVLHSVAGG